MDSLEKIIADMEDESKRLMEVYNSTNALYSISLKATSTAITTYLTRLKALRENSNDKKEDDEHPAKNHKDR
jgi:hypothetical protein